MDINSYLYNDYSNANSILDGMKAGGAGKTWRGGVTGWKDNTKSSSSDSSSSTSGVSTEAAEYLTSVKDFGGKLNDAMTALAGSGKTESIFASLGAESSDADALTVSISDRAKAKEFLQGGGEKKVEVYQVAESQQNSGTDLSATATNNMQEGKNTFKIEKDGQTFSFEVNVNSTDSNRTVQQKVADAINKNNIGIKASVSDDPITKDSSLVLSGTETGEDNSFTVKDTGSSDVISKLGAGTATRTAKDAHYSVDGKDEYSGTNEVDIGDGMTAKLKNETKEEVTVKAGQDQSAITNSIYDFVNNFNQLRETAANMSDDSNAGRLKSRLDGLASAYSNTLEQAGITTNEDGYLQIDTEKMNEAILNGDAEKALGEDSSFTKSMTTLSAQAEEDPGRFLSYKTKTQSEESESEATDALNAYEDMSYSFTPWQQAQLNQWDMVGMLFNATA